MVKRNKFLRKKEINYYKNINFCTKEKFTFLVYEFLEKLIYGFLGVKKDLSQRGKLVE